MGNTIIPKTMKTNPKDFDKKNYQRMAREEIKRLPQGHKPTLLLHCCCGVCPLYPLTFLCPIFDVTIFYSNSNIYPSQEYYRRRQEVLDVIDIMKRDYGFHIGFAEASYDNETFTREVIAPYANTREGSSRCLACYDRRMEDSYDYADEHGFDYFTTVMTVSRQKSSTIINMVGEQLEKTHKAKYFYSDFKKDSGNNIGVQLRKKYGLYNQVYCGCKLSYFEAQKKAEKSKN